MNKYIYLAGPITGVGEEAREWRGRAQRLLPQDWQGIDPLVVEAHTVTPEAIVALDYAWIEKSHAVLARVDQPSWGTAMELVYAHNLKLPIVGFGQIEKPSPWLFHHLTVHKPDLASGIDYLKGLLA